MAGEMGLSGWIGSMNTTMMTATYPSSVTLVDSPAVHDDLVKTGSLSMKTMMETTMMSILVYDHLTLTLLPSCDPSSFAALSSAS